MSLNKVTAFVAKYRIENDRIIPEYNKQPLRGLNKNKIEVEFKFQNRYKAV